MDSPLIKTLEESRKSKEMETKRILKGPELHQAEGTVNDVCVCHVCRSWYGCGHLAESRGGRSASEESYHWSNCWHQQKYLRHYHTG